MVCVEYVSVFVVYSIFWNITTVYFIFLQMLLCLRIWSVLVETITWLNAELKIYSQKIGRWRLFSDPCIFSNLLIDCLSFMYPFFSSFKYFCFPFRMSSFREKILAYKIWTFLMGIWCFLSIRRAFLCFVPSICLLMLIVRYLYLCFIALRFTIKIWTLKSDDISSLFCLLCSVVSKDIMLQSTSSCVREKQMMNFKDEMYR